MDAPPQPRFPVEAFPAEIREMVTEVSRFVQVPVAAVGAFALGTLSAAAVRGGHTVSVHGTHREPITLYVLIALGVGERKSEVVRLLKAPLEDYERTMREREREGRLAKLAEKKRLERALKRAEKDENRADIERLGQEIAACRVPPESRLLIGDCTMESLVVRLAEQGGNLGLLDPDGGLFGIANGRYSKDGAAHFEPLLKAWSDEPILVDRITRETVSVERARLSIGMAVQPSVLCEFVGNPEFQGRGLRGRFLMCRPEGLVGTRLGWEDPIPQEVLTGWSEMITRMLARAGRSDTPGELRLHPGAAAVWRDFADQTELLQREGERLAPIRDWASKAAGQVARIAGLLHLAEHAAADPLPALISQRTMERACDFGDYFREAAHAALLPEDPLHRDLRRLVAWLQRRRAHVVSERDVKDGVSYRERRGDDWRAVLGEAVQQGVLRRLPEEPPGREGGRPAGPRYQVHPELVR